MQIVVTVTLLRRSLIVGTPFLKLIFCCLWVFSHHPSKTEVCLDWAEIAICYKRFFLKELDFIPLELFEQKLVFFFSLRLIWLGCKFLCCQISSTISITCIDFGHHKKNSCLAFIHVNGTQTLYSRGLPISLPLSRTLTLRHRHTHSLSLIHTSRIALCFKSHWLTHSSTNTISNALLHIQYISSLSYAHTLARTCTNTHTCMHMYKHIHTCTHMFRQCPLPLFLLLTHSLLPTLSLSLSHSHALSESQTHPLMIPQLAICSITTSWVSAWARTVER